VECPVCGALCQLVYVGTDSFGAVREWTCSNSECLWVEGDDVPDEDVPRVGERD
jgi:hypothetical protein